MANAGPLIVQSDLTVLLDVHDPDFEEARAALGVFASLEKSPEHLHTYRITPLSLWNAAAAGVAPDDVMRTLSRHSRYEVPQDVDFVVRETMSRFGALVMKSAIPGNGTVPAASFVPPAGRRLLLVCSDIDTDRRIRADRGLSKWLSPEPGGFGFRLEDRGTIKLELLKRGWPVKDEAPLDEGDPMPLALRSVKRSGGAWSMRPYQIDAVDAFTGKFLPGTGYGVIVLPCGSGKTVVAMAAMAAIGRKTLVITTNIAAVRQWIDELLDKTDIDPQSVGEYSGAEKSIKPVTVATYQILTWRPDKNSDFPHFDIFRKERWGLVICDEVHLLPAPVFRVVAEIQAVRRLGLTATLVREDGREEDVFGLIGPKRYDVPWKDLERKGFIAQAWCNEIRVPLEGEKRLEYAVADPRRKVRLAAENPAKEDVAAQLVAHHAGESILVIGQYLDQLGRYARLLSAPMITGATPETERETLYADFRAGGIKVLVVSKVANFAIDLPDASVAIQISGSFGSRQEEAQRLGRILRPKEKSSFFYSLVSRYTVEEEFAANRRKFLTEQGYRYRIEAWE
ncbi:MAG: DNA repair helicase XPB [Rectinemataceae bacterium]